MDTNLYVVGNWIIPEVSTTPLTGNLCFKNGNIKLSISTLADDVLYKVFKSNQILHIITGIGDDEAGKKAQYTLIDSVITKYSRGLGYNYQLTATYIIKGRQYEKFEDIEVAELSFAYPEIASWIGGIKAEIRDDQQGQFTVVVESPGPLLIYDNDVKLSIHKSLHRTHRHEYIDVFTIRNDSYISLTLSKKLDLNGGLQQLEYFRKFLSLISDHSIRLQQVDFTPYSRKEIVELNRQMKPTPNLDIARSTTLSNNTISKIANDPFFTLSDVTSVFESIYTKWLKTTNLQMMTDLYIEIYYNKDMENTTRFLNYIKIFEIYFNQACLGVSGRAKIKDLKVKLKIVLSNCSFLDEVINVDLDTFIDILRNTRDNLSHYFPERRNPSINGIEWHSYLPLLRCISQFLLLKEIGITEENILKRQRILYSFFHNKNFIRIINKGKTTEFI